MRRGRPTRTLFLAVAAAALLATFGCNRGGALQPTPFPVTWLTPMIVLHTPARTPTSAPPSLTPTPRITTEPTAVALAPTRTPTAPPTPTHTPTAPPVPSLALPALPDVLTTAFLEASKGGHFHIQNVGSGEVSPDPNLQIAALPSGSGGADAAIRPVDGIGLFNWVYVPVAAFPTVADDLPMTAIQAFWRGDADPIRVILQSEAPTLVVDRDTRDWLASKWGGAADPGHILITPTGSVAREIWRNRKNTFGIVGFDQLVPSLKMLTVDGLNPFSTTFEPATWPLMRGFELVGAPQVVSAVQEVLDDMPGFSYTNRDRDKLTVLAMTGVTALTRATAYQMEQTGITLPARDVGPFLLDSDLVHTSNEVSFSADCPYPEPAGGMTFCSREKYFDLLKAINLRIVELTGNHLNDYGRDAFLHTLDLYDQAGMLRFGGGRTAADARQPALIEDHMNKLAFLGCNPVGPVYDWAKDDLAGSAPCEDDYLQQEIADLKSQGFIVIMTIQYEEYYFYETPPAQRAFFKKYADFGADLVMGSQAHTPQGFDFIGDTFVHYGIGNLFFDQMDYINTRQMFADRLVFYGGRLLGAQLFTGLNEDYSRVRPMIPAERVDFLRTIFEASGW
jgi:poly-gamma-glutamate synthesis protein (capsule biosynthesis protein)